MNRRIYLVYLVLVVSLLAWPALANAQQPKVRQLTEQELLDMMMGSSIQASRGNNTASMVQRVKDAIAQGRKFTLIAAEDVPDGWTTVTPAGIGGGGAWEYVRERTKKQNLPTIPNASAKAIEALSKHVGKKFNAVVRIEAAGATLSALMAASEMGVPLVDACLSGRARPEVSSRCRGSSAFRRRPPRSSHALATPSFSTRPWMTIARRIWRGQSLSPAAAARRWR